jgi:hypothetical protein
MYELRFQTLYVNSWRWESLEGAGRRWEALEAAGSRWISPGNARHGAIWGRLHLQP